MNKDNIYIFKNYVNSFHYLYQDAETFHKMAREKEAQNSFDAKRFCRTSVLLYILSMEALINRALGAFLPERQRKFVMDREDRFSIEDKWQLLPLLASPSEENFELGNYPWTHFRELVRLRNDFVHPKHDRPAYYQALTLQRWTPLSWKDVPEDLHISQKSIIYPQSNIPKDPYAILAVHVDKAKEIVDDTINELDRMMGGKLKNGNWYKSDSMELIHPPNSRIEDIALESANNPPGNIT